jgi:hypothetical protein
MKNSANKTVVDPPAEPLDDPSPESIALKTALNLMAEQRAERAEADAREARIADRDRNFLLGLVGDLRIQNAILRTEKAERDAPSWATLVRAAHAEGAAYDRVLRWCDRALANGRENEAKLDDNGRKWVNTKALRAYLRG